MKFLTLLLLCCVAKNINGATITTLGKFMEMAQKQMNSAVDAVKQKSAAQGVTSNVKAPKVPIPSNPNQVIVNPPKIPLPNPKCDFKGLSALLKALFGRVKGSCSNVKKSRGPLKQQCQAAKANFTTEFSGAFYNATEQISYEFPTCSEVVNPAIKEFTSCAGKVFDALTAASSGEDTKKCGKSIEIAMKNLTIALKALLLSMNSVTGSAKPAAGTNAADAVETSNLLLSIILQTLTPLFDMVTSVSTESSVPIGDITKTLGDAVGGLNKKCEGGTKIIGSVCIEFTFILTITSKTVSSVDLEAFTEECGKMESDLGEATDSVSEIEVVDEDEEDEDDEETTIAPSGGTSSAPSEETTSAPSGDTSSAASGDTSSAPSEDTSGAPSGDTSSATSTPTEEKPTAADCLTKISGTINISFTSITKTCGALKTDVPALSGGNVDASLSGVNTSLSAILTLIKTSGTASVTESSQQMDAAICAFVKSLTDFFTCLDAVIASLSSDSSVAGTTAVKALQLIKTTILSISCSVTKSVSVFFEKLNLFTTPTLDATFEAIGKIDAKTADCKTVATDLTKITSPKELNAESCKKVIEGLGKSSTDAIGKISTKFSAKFELRISFIFKAFGYSVQKLKSPKVTAGITKIQGSFSTLIKEVQTACTCAKDSKAKAEKDGSSGEGSGEESSGEGSGEKSSGEGSGEKSSGEGSGEKSKCKPLSTNSFKSFFEALLAFLDGSKATATDPTLDPKALEILNLTVKSILTSITGVFKGISAPLTEETIDASVLLTLGLEMLTKATSDTEIDLETLTTSTDNLLCYGNTVDAATPAVDSCKKIETKISEPPAEGETKDTKAILTELSTSATSALSVLCKSVPSFTKYYSKPVDGVGKAITKISSSIGKFIKGVTTTTDVKIILQAFLVEIGSALQELSAAYTVCSANTKTELDPKGYNAQSGLKYVFKSTTTIINSILVSFKFQVDIPADLTEFCTGMSDAVKADATSPDTEPSELGDKVKTVCDKHKAATGGSGSDEDETGEDTTGEDESGDDTTGEDESGDD